MKIKRFLDAFNFATAIFALWIISGGVVEAQCSVGFTYQTGSTNKDKCGYESFTDPDANGVDHFYLQKEIVEAASIAIQSADYPVDDSDNGSLNSDVTLKTTPTDCSESVINLSGNENENIVTCGGIYSDNNASPIGYDGAILWRINYHNNYFGSNPGNSGTETNHLTVYSSLDNFAGILNYPSAVVTLTKTKDSQIEDHEIHNIDYYGNTDDRSFTITTTLTTEYKDSLLASTISGLISLPAYSTNWPTGSSAAAASFSLDSTHVHGSGTKMEYRLMIPNSIKDAIYHCKWLKVTIDASGHRTPSPQTGTVTGTGDPVNAALGDIRTEEVPSEPSTVTEENATVEKVDMPPSPPGNGGQ